MAIVLTLPFIFTMPPAQGLATMIAVLVGGLSGGLMSGILTGIPGTPSSVATTFDGFPMARRGEPGLPLALAFGHHSVGAYIRDIVSSICSATCDSWARISAVGLFHAGDVCLNCHRLVSW